MGLLDSMFGRKKDDNEPLALAMRGTLYGDVPVDQWGPAKTDADPNSPWNPFAEARAHLQAGETTAAIMSWRKIIARTGLEPRFTLQAWHFLRQHGVPPSTKIAKQVLGIVVEVAIPEGLDIVAAYADHSARYYNHSGKSIIWEHPDRSLDGTIDDLLAAAKTIVTQIGPHEGARPAPPPLGQVLLSFLTPSGLHYGLGGFNTLSTDPMGGPVVQQAMKLMMGLMEKTEKK